MPHNFIPLIHVKTFVSGDLVTTTDLNEFAANIKYLTQRKPMASSHTDFTTTTVPNNDWTDIVLDTPTLDSEHGFDSNGAYEVQVSGWYQVMAAVAFSGNTSGARAVRWVINGFPSISGIASISGTSATSSVCLSRMIALVEGNVLTLQGWQDSGGDLDTEHVNTEEVSFMDIAYFSRFFGF